MIKMQSKAISNIFLIKLRREILFTETLKDTENTRTHRKDVFFL